MFDQFSLVGKAALITGASRGLGRVITLALADAGADVVLIARDAERLARVAAEVQARGRRAVTIPADLVVMEELRRAVDAVYEAFEKIDVLVCNAGISPIWKR
ncbi:MAG TPA: SDR family NAD(P)-dependent oxidoreductase, partial [Ktedonobacterales bacterium]|nr:SDR family NAD(P)-dependent oxidoreductase [Ktedonobacterales bacterium]